MKLKDISRLCAKSHEICICDMRGAQWLGDGHAMYPVFGLPELDVDTAPAVLDFNEEKAEALDVRNVYLEDRYNMREADDYEEALTGVVLRFLHGGGQLDAWRTESGGIVLIDPIYTKPYFADDAAEPTLYLRRRDNGDNYVIGKSGMFVTAIITPEDPDAKTADDLADKFRRLAAAMAAAGTAVPVDPATGEVLENG